MKIAVCCIAKNENKYIQEFVEWYKKLGFTNVIIYDNNDEETFDDVLKDEIELGFVKIENFRNKSICQLLAYENCYTKYKKNYDWILFIDVDEYLVLKNHKTISDFCSLSCFNEGDIICFNWMMYDDNGLVRYDNRKLNERFTNPVPFDTTFSYPFPENRHIKIMVKTNQRHIHFNNPHITMEGVLYNANGEKLDNKSPFQDIKYENAYLKHFSQKTIEEYIWKWQRGYSDQTLSDARSKINQQRFFILNKKTPEKIKVCEEYNFK